MAWRGGVAAAVVRTHLLKEAMQQLSYLVPLGAVKTGGYTVGIHRYLPNGWDSRKASLPMVNGSEQGTADPSGHRVCVCIHVCMNIRVCICAGGRVQVRQVFLG